MRSAGYTTLEQSNQRSQESRRRLLGLGATDAPAEPAQLSSFEGAHQAAILSEPTPATAFLAFDVIADSKPELRDLLRTITQRMRLVYAGGPPANLGPASPPDDNGVLQICAHNADTVLHAVRDLTKHTRGAM